MTPPLEILGFGLVIVGPGDFSFDLFDITEYSVQFSVSNLFTDGGLQATGLKDDKPFLFVFVMKAWSFVAGTLMVVSCTNFAELWIGFGVLIEAFMFDVTTE